MEEFGRRGGFGRSNFGGSRGRGRRDDFEEKPVKVGEEYDVEIESVAEKGDGVAKIKGLVVFVPGAQKGEKLRIRIKELKRKCAIAEKAGEASGAVLEAATEDEVEEAHEEAAGEIPPVEESSSEESEDSQEEEY